MTQVNSIKITDGHKVESRIIKSNFDSFYKKHVENYYEKYFCSEENLNYLRSLGVDLPDNSYTMVKLRNKIQPYKRNNDVFGSREVLADALMESSILDDLVNDLLSNGIIKNEYFLKNNGKKWKHTVYRTDFDEMITRYSSHDASTTIYNSEIEMQQAYASIDCYKSIDIFGENKDLHNIAKNNVILLEGITIPIINNTHGEEDIKYAFRLLKKLMPKGYDLVISNDNNDYDYLVEADNDTIKQAIIGDVSYYLYTRIASGFPENTFFEMNNSHDDINSYAGRLLEHLFAYAIITDIDGNEYQSDISKSIPQLKSRGQVINHQNRDWDNEIEFRSGVSSEIVSAFNFQDQAWIDGKDIEIENDEDFDKIREKIRNKLIFIEDKFTKLEDEILNLDISDKLVIDIMDVLNNTKDHHHQYLNEVLNMIDQLKAKFGSFEELKSVLLKMNPDQ